MGRIAATEVAATFARFWNACLTEFTKHFTDNTSRTEKKQ